MEGKTQVIVNDNHGIVNIGQKGKRVRPSGIWPSKSSEKRYYRRSFTKRIKDILSAVPPWREISTSLIAELLDTTTYQIERDLLKLEEGGVLVSTRYGPSACASIRKRFWRLRQPEDQDPKIVGKSMEYMCPRCEAPPGKECVEYRYGITPDATGIHGDRLREARGR